MAKSITITKTNTKKKTETDMDVTIRQPIWMIGASINSNNLRFVDKYGIIHTSREACWEANRA